MSNKRLSSWFQSILPTNYRQIKSQTSKYQLFLNEQLPDSITGSVQVINVSTEQIVIVTGSAQVTNYLRLHARELQQQFDETFKCSQKLSFKTMPESLLQIDQRPPARKPVRVSDEAIKSINNNAQWIEDEKLRQALESLARQLKNKSDITDL